MDIQLPVPEFTSITVDFFWIFYFVFGLIAAILVRYNIKQENKLELRYNNEPANGWAIFAFFIWPIVLPVMYGLQVDLFVDRIERLREELKPKGRKKK